MLSVIPWCNIEAVNEVLKAENVDKLLYGNPHYVIDCIDDVNTKADLIAYCLKNDIQVLTSMGAGGKADPTRLRIAPLGDCINDPLATKIKWKMKKLNVNAESVMTLFSLEKTISELLPLDEEQKLAPQVFLIM